MSVQVYHVVDGPADGPAVVVSNSIGSTLEMWEPQVTPLAAAHFVGLSLGGVTGIWLGENEPDRVRRLVLCCTSAQPGNSQMRLDRAKTVRAEGMADIADGIVHRWFTQDWTDANPIQAKKMREMAAGADDEQAGQFTQLILEHLKEAA